MDGNRDNVHIEMASGLPPVLADPGRIVQVVVNLLTNAARNSPEGSRIRVSATQEGENVTISVVDQGRGMSPEQIAQLFRKLPRRDRDAGAREDLRPGWGLSICRGIVEAHGGRIFAESEGPDKGTRFRFTIPIAEEVAKNGRRGTLSATDGARMPANSTDKILVVDDDPQTLRSVREALSNAGYVPVVTGDANEAIALFNEHSPQLALLDLVLPGSDGIELMHGIVEKADVPVIFLSAYGHEDAIAQALDNGAADYLVKPFSPTELAARIRAAIRKHTVPRLVVPSEPFLRGNLKVDYTRRRVTISGAPVDLTRIEYFVLQELAVNAGRTVFYEDILRRIWAKRGSNDRRPLHAAVKNIRRKLGDDAKNPKWIFNEPRVGYRLGKAE